MLTVQHAVINHFNIGFEKTRFGLVDFSYEANDIFYLGTYYTSADIKAAVSSMPYYGSYTNTPAGIRSMHYNQFTTSAGDWANVQNIAVVITDGKMASFYKTYN